MHEALHALGEVRALRDPVLLAAFTGFTDGPGAAALAIRTLVKEWDAQPLAEMDPERFYDFTVQRPRTRLKDGERTLEWPENQFWVASPEGAGRDFILFAGVEPHLRWRTFCAALEDLLRETGSTTSITLGAQPSAVPHTRDLPVTLSASHPEFEERFGLKAPASRYQGQTGIVGVLNVHLRSLGWQNASLWGMAPHYLTVGPNPNIAIQLLKLVDRGFGTSTSLEGLREDAALFDEQVSQVLDESDEAKAYVRQLEEQYDSSQPASPSSMPEDRELPPTPELLDDLERFLREQRKDDR
ncbi:MAG: PAC2 family protein [Dehalococcoidia bacterium]|nr:PAC2 family protein [Dehalococcoidia bacterium]